MQYNCDYHLIYDADMLSNEKTIYIIKLNLCISLSKVGVILSLSNKVLNKITSNKNSCFSKSKLYMIIGNLSEAKTYTRSSLRMHLSVEKYETSGLSQTITRRTNGSQRIDQWAGLSHGVIAALVRKMRIVT